MTSPKQTLREIGLRPKKALGQNFLVHSESADKIAAWAGAQEGDTVLEIGPGLGALTDALGRLGCSVVAIEKDRDLVAWLTKRWPDALWLKIIHGDALKLDARPFKMPLTKLRVVANLPYSISTPILERLLDQMDCFADMVLLLQEEVVDRITAKPGTHDYGRLTIWIQTLCETERGPRITRGSFHPEPDVESRLVRLTPRNEPLVPAAELPDFLKTVGFLFQHRRKTIRNALRDARQADWDPDRALSTAGIDPQRRPETLTIAELRTLAGLLHKKEIG
jgi:16S rRNA (adenine1518-N6/adenine1519-N6)-dimethyltransferase